MNNLFLSGMGRFDFESNTINSPKTASLHLLAEGWFPPLFLYIDSLSHPHIDSCPSQSACVLSTRPSDVRKKPRRIPCPDTNEGSNAQEVTSCWYGCPKESKIPPKDIFVNISFLSPGWTTQGTKEAIFGVIFHPICWKILNCVEVEMPLATIQIWFLSTAIFSCSFTSCHPQPCTALIFAGTGWRQKVDLVQVWLGDGQGLVKVLARHFLQIRAWQKKKAYGFSCW